ncbi:MAG: cell division protein ZapA [Desulfobacterales bacterium]
MNIKLFGESYKFKTSLEMVQAQKVVDLLTQEISSIQDQFSEGTSEQNKKVVLVMAALNLAKKNIELVNLNREMKLSIGKRSKDLLKILDLSLNKDEKMQL